MQSRSDGIVNDGPRRPLRGEAATTSLAAACFFLLMCGYFMLRPLRETMGLDEDIDDLHWLFLGTLGCMVPATLAFSWLASRLSRRACVTATFLFVIACLVCFAAAMTFFDEHLGRATGRAFYIWLSVINVLIISVYWACIVDSHTESQGRRLFGYIGIGGTAGAIVGPAITALTIRYLGQVGLIVASTGCFCATLALLRAGLFPALDRAEYVGSGDGRRSRSRQSLGGAAIDGLVHIVTRPRLRMLALYIIGITILASLLYFEQGRLIKAAVPERDDRTRIFGLMGTGGQIATVLVQLLLTARVLTRYGLAPALLSLPVLMTCGFCVLLAAPLVVTLVMVEIGRNAAAHALAKPAREVIFTTVPPDDKYKAKSAIDTFIYRSGDAGGAMLDQAVTGGSATTSAATAGIITGAIVVGVTLGLVRVSARRTSVD